jgi:hypothetical protein
VVSRLLDVIRAAGRREPSGRTAMALGQLGRSASTVPIRCHRLTRPTSAWWPRCWPTVEIERAQERAARTSPAHRGRWRTGRRGGRPVGVDSTRVRSSQSTRHVPRRRLPDWAWGRSCGPRSVTTTRKGSSSPTRRSASIHLELPEFRDNLRAACPAQASPRRSGADPHREDGAWSLPPARGRPPPDAIQPATG